MARSKAAKRKPADAKQPKMSTSQRFWRELKGYAEALLVAYVIVTFVFTTVGVVGSSMRPNLDGGSGRLPQSLFTGDRVFIPKYDNWLRRAGVLGPHQRGEVVVMREPENAPAAQARPGNRRPFFIKRMIGQAGDRIRIEEGQVYVNGHAVDQAFITESGEISPDPVDFPIVVADNGEIIGFCGLAPGTCNSQLGGVRAAPIDAQAVQFFYDTTIAGLAPLPDDAPEGEPFVHELIVPEGYAFVLGDNRESARGGSEDSRYFGPVPALSITGRASAVIWPPMRDGEWNWRRLGPPEAFNAIPAPE